jgi:predicted extracellular nuclease
VRAHHKHVTAAVGAIALSAGVASVATTSAVAAPSPTAEVVINEVYGGGGNSGAAFDRDFIELVNKTGTAISLEGWSVQYGSATSTTWSGRTDLSGSIPAGGRFVVGQAFGSDTSLPDVPVDLGGAIAMSGTTGKVALVNSTSTLTGCGAKTGAPACSDLPQVVDFVGWGTANDWAGAGGAPATTNATSVSRSSTSTNTADNAADFTAGTPTPAAGSTPPPGTPVVRSIAEVQGTGSASPLVGENVIIEGVVTAAYPTGGFHGFSLQTQGTGAQPSPSGASDGVFVLQAGSTTPLDSDAVVGNYVRVTGKVSESFGLTQVTAAGADIVDAGAGFGPIRALAVPWPTTDAGRESIEGMLFQPTGDYTVTNTFATNQFGEVGLAVGDHPLLQSTEVAAPGTPEAAAVVADNAARAVTLDDGASSNFTASSFSTSTCGARPVPCLLNGDLTPAYVSTTEPVRVGASATFTAPVVVDYRFNLWRFQPTQQVVGPDNAASPVTFTDTRTAAPEAGDINQLGTADLRVTSFNVLNYFTTLGAGDSSCLAFYDRDSSGNTVRDGCDQRGAWDSGDLARQQQKIVSAINSLDADVVGLMEIENSARLGEPRDEALASLVAALNADAGQGTWAFVPSSTELPATELQDFITSAMIYKPAQVMRVGESRALGTASREGQAFANAREPIAQVFKKKNGKGDKFLFVVNHFKSKGSAGPFPGDEDTGDGQGASVTSRILQAQALRDWVPTVLDETSTGAVVLAGDFNSYTMEDPMDVLDDAGYTDVGSRFDEGSYSYSFSGLSGSLDHILVNDAALRMATGADHWNINAGESLALEYSRFNYHATDFHAPGPYRSSDHDPVVLGLKAFVG